MQAVESEILILYHTDLRGQWPEAAARTLAARLPYARRLAVRTGGAAQRASLAGIALALRALARILGRRVSAGEIVFAQGHKPRLAPRRACAAAAAPATSLAATGAEDTGLPDFSISHAGPWVGCAALAHGRVGFDVEPDNAARSADWVVREALLKATGAGIRAARQVRTLEVRDGCVCWHGERWHAQRLELFPGAAACVMSSVAVRELEAHAVTLAELFDP